MSPYVSLALGAALLIGAGLAALRRPAPAVVNDDIDWL